MRQNLKPLLIALLALLSFTLTAAERTRTIYTPYDFDTPRKNAPAPKGYKAFYITHYGRHGARYINREYEYDAVVSLLNCGSELTPLGKEIKARFDEVLPQLKGRATDLTPMGREQHYRLGKRMVEAWPDIFKGKCYIEAHSSDIPRCVLSMYSFLDGVKECRPSVDYFADVDSRLVPLLKKSGKILSNRDSLFRASCDVDAMYSRLFTDVEKAKQAADVHLATTCLYYFCQHLLGAGIDDTVMQKALTDEQADRFANFDDEKFSYECGWGNPRNVATSYPLVEHFIATAEKDIAEGKVDVRLRFGHDNTLTPFMALLELEPIDASHIHSAEIPMASNLRWVFARNKEGHIILKVQYNENDITPWIAWETFREECMMKVMWAKSYLEKPVVRHSAADKNTPSTPLYSAHRGLQPFGPENSVASLEAAAERRMWGIETDFRITSDSVVICMHDATLDRTTTGSGRVIDHTFDQIRALRVKEVNSRGATRKLYDYSQLTDRQKQTPTMDEYFRLCRRYGCVAFLELKEDNGIVRRVHEAIKKYDMEGRCVVSSGNMELLKTYRAIGGNELIHKIGAKPEQIPTLLKLGNAALAFNYPDLTVSISRDINGHRVESLKELVDFCHSLGLKICFRAVDSEEATAQSLALGIDYLPTNTMW